MAGVHIGDKHGIEHEQIEKSGLDVTFHSIATGKLRRYFSWQNMLDVFKVSIWYFAIYRNHREDSPTSTLFKVGLCLYHL